MPWNNIPDLHVIPVREGDALRLMSPFSPSQFVPVATHGVGIKRIDPVATPDGTPFTFSMPQVASLNDPTFPDVFVATTIAIDAYSYDPGDGHLFASSSANNLVKINKTTGVTVATIGPLVTSMEGLEYSPGEGVIWGVSDTTNSLYSINPSTAVATLIGALTVGGTPITTPQSLARDPVTGRLYLLVSSDEIYLVDTSDATCQLIASTGIGSIAAGLAFDTRRRVLWMTSSSGGTHNLYEVDPDTAIATLKGATVGVAPFGMAYDTDDDKLFYNNSSTSLYRFDFPPATAEWNISSWDTALYIDGNPNFIDNGGVATVIFDSTILPYQEEYYIIGVFRVSDSRTLDFSILHRDKANLDIFDSTSAQVDLDMLERALGLAGHNAKYRLLNMLAGQPSEHEVAMFNPGIVDMSIDPDNLDDDTGLAEKLEFTTAIDSNGDTIREVGGE